MSPSGDRGSVLPLGIGLAAACLLAGVVAVDVGAAFLQRQQLLALADAAATRGLGVIVTHSLDGDLGHAAACALAQALPQPPWPCGLAAHVGLRRVVDTQPWLAAPASQGLDGAGRPVP